MKFISGSGHPLSRLGFLYAIINIGLSQIAFNTITGNVEQFPRAMLFYIWVLLGFQILPLAILFVLDVLVEKVSNRGTGFLLWHCVLCLLLTLSILRQLHTIHYEQFKLLFFLPLPLIYAIPGIVICWISFRWSKTVETYLSYFGAVSVIMTLLFLQHGRMTERPTATAQETGAAGPPVFMIIFDELSYDLVAKDGRIDPVSFPNLAALATDGLWFTNATSNHWMTEWAVPSLLTGHTIAGPATPSLFEKLPAGYHVQLVETEMKVENWLHDRNTSNIESFRGKSYFLLHRPIYTVRYVAALAYQPFFGHTVEFQSVGMLLSVFPSVAMVSTRAYHLTLFNEMSSFFKTVDEKKASGQFSFWHASVPHTPFIFAADGSLRPDTGTYFPTDRRLWRTEYKEVMANYRAQAEFSDRILGLFVDLLRKENLYDKAIVIIVADHGLRIWGDLYRHIDLTARVPLILHGPGITPGVCSLDVQLIDLVPTLLDVLKIPYKPSEFEGVSAFASTRPQRRKVLEIYPRDFAYDEKTNSWLPVPLETKGSIHDTVLNAVLSQMNGFSAEQVVGDVFAARDQHQDFLKIYLSRHFPESVSDAELESLRTQAKNADSLSDTPSNNFRGGLAYFFVALAETQRIAQGHHEDPVAVQAHWEAAVRRLKKVGDLQPWMAEDTEKILKEADSDGDNKLSEQELAAIITSREH